MNIRRFAALASALIITSAASGCSFGGISMKNTVNEKNLKELGRVYYSDGAAYCALSGSGVEFTFTGTACSVTVSGDSAAADSSRLDDHARVAIYLNGERVVDDMVDSPTETYEVFKSESEIFADVAVVKLSESPMSTIAITDISVEGGEISPAEDSELLIEFIGDSITCGYGVDDEDRNHHFSTRTEDVTKAYAYKTAKALGADWSMVSFSGYGIISGYSDGEKKVPEQSLPQYYTKMGYCWNDNNGFKPSEIEWGFGRLPNAIVLNLGTNDASYCKNIPERCEEFRDEYINFLKTIRSKNPEAPILCALGIMGADLFPYIEEAVKLYSEQTGDSNVYTLKLNNQSEADGIAADWHPTEATHEKAAAQLSEKLKEILGL